MVDEIPEFDDRNLLPEGFYYPTLEEFKNRFVTVENTEKRVGLFEKYKKFCIKCLDTNALKCHFVNGSYVTRKLKPGDIDLLIILDGITVRNDPVLYNEFKEIKDWEKMKELYSCHTFAALDLPSNYKKREIYEHHEFVKNKVIGWWKTNYLDEKRTIKDPVKKGVIILCKKEIEKIRSLDDEYK